MILGIFEGNHSFLSLKEDFSLENTCPEGAFRGGKIEKDCVICPGILEIQNSER